MNIPAESDEQAVPPTEEPREEMTPADEAEAWSLDDGDEELDMDFDFDSDDDDDEYDDDEDIEDDDDEDEDEDELADTAVSLADSFEPEPAAAESADEAPEPEQPEPVDLPVTRLTLGAFEEATVDEEDAEAPRPTKVKKQRRQPLRTPRKNQPTVPQVTERFAACGRCSYFWAGYRVLFGQEELETAVAHSKSGWLELNWDERMTELVVKSYGVPLDNGFYHYDGCCDECRRHFIYEASDNEDEADAFRIEITPYMAK